MRDLNGNGTADSNEPAIDGAVVVLDGGRRSERSRRGRFAFEAVPSGEHTVTLLADSLPDGALIAGEATRRAALGRDRMAVDLPFLVSIETRAEIRKVFPGKTAAAPRAVPGSPVAGRAPVPRLPPPSSSRPTATAPAVTARRRDRLRACKWRPSTIRPGRARWSAPCRGRACRRTSLNRRRAARTLPTA